jgi:hypothetical protein
MVVGKRLQVKDQPALKANQGEGRQAGHGNDKAAGNVEDP